MTNRYVKFECQAVFTSDSFTAFGSCVHILDVSGEDITGDQQFIYPETSVNRLRRNRIQGPKKFSGPIDTPLFAIEAPSLIYYALGAVSTSCNMPVACLNIHTITKACTIPVLQMAIGRDVNEHQYNGGLVNSMTIDYAPDDVIAGTFGMVFRREIGSVACHGLASVTFPDFNTACRAFGGTETTVDFCCSAVTFVESLSVTVENNVAEDAFALTAPYLPAGIIAGQTISGSMDLRFDTITNYTDFICEATNKVNLDATYGACVCERRIIVCLPQVAYDTSRLPTDNLERFVQTIEFTPERDSCDDAIIVSVTNECSNAELVA